MRKVKDIIWGLVLIAIGIIWGGNALGLFDINIFFDGWWTLFIIIPSFIGLFDERDKTGSIVGLIVGVFLLLASLDLINFELMWKLLFPTILVIIGVSIIFKDRFNKKINGRIKELNEKISTKDSYTAMFSSHKLNFKKKEFNGTNLNSIFGGIKLDLRDSIISGDVVINATSIFGGIDIYVPDNYNVEVKSNSIFGGVSNDKKYNDSLDDDSNTIYINASCVFGGVEIK